MNNRQDCIFKQACRNCRLVETEDRPTLCIAIDCEHYVPCKKCKLNKTIGVDKVCSECKGGSSYTQTLVTDDRGKFLEVDLEPGSEEERIDLRGSTPEFTLPGVPPGSYSDLQKEYYRSQWEEYSTYYRDPTLKIVVHQLIQTEIRLTLISHLALVASDSSKTDLEDKRNVLINQMKALRSQLPKDKAESEDADEAILSRLYENYLEKKKDRVKSGIRRVFSTEAVALSSVLYFPVNLDVILRKAGYPIATEEQVIEHISKFPEDAIELAEFLGFKINERYALTGEQAEAITESLEEED